MFVPVWLNLAEYPFRFHQYETEGGIIHYINEGEGEPIILLHGWLTWSFLYRQVIKELLGHRHCMAVDLLGYGLSDKPIQRSYTMAAQAERLREWVANTVQGPFTLVAHDIHSILALRLAEVFPDQLRHLLLLNPIFPGQQEAFMRPQGILGRLRGERSLWRVRKFLRQRIGYVKGLGHEAFYHYLEPYKLKIERSVVKGKELSNPAWDTPPAIKTPLTIYQAKGLAKAFPLPQTFLSSGAEVETISQGGLLLPETHASLIAQFLLAHTGKVKKEP